MPERRTKKSFITRDVLIDIHCKKEKERRKIKAALETESFVHIFTSSLFFLVVWWLPLVMHSQLDPSLESGACGVGKLQSSRSVSPLESVVPRTSNYELGLLQLLFRVLTNSARNVKECNFHATGAYPRFILKICLRSAIFLCAAALNCTYIHHM